MQPRQWMAERAPEFRPDEAPEGVRESPAGSFALRVLVTRRDNQLCPFRRGSGPGGTDLPVEVVEGELARLAAAGHGAILTGGEPLLHPALEDLVQQALRRGCPTVGIDTNATRLGLDDRAARLRAAGLSSILVAVIGTGPEDYAVAAGRETTIDSVWQGIEAAIEVGLEVVIRLPLARDLAPAAARIEAVLHRFPRLQSFVLEPVGHGPSGADSLQALDPEEWSVQIEAACKILRPGDRLRVSPDFPLPPCVVELSPESRVVLVDQFREADSPRDNDADPACATCSLSRRCVLSAEQLRQMAGERPRRPVSWSPPARPVEPSVRFEPEPDPSRPYGRGRVLGPQDAERFFHVEYEYEEGSEVDQPPTTRLGIIYQCNQPCTFCQLAEMNTHIPPVRVLAALEKSRRRGAERVIFTGGEPTMCRHLPDYLRRAVELGYRVVEMQSNATLLDRPGRAEELAAAGLTDVQVSLHGPDSEISDRLTAAPGTHQRTLAGITRLLEAGARVLLNHLIFRDNCHLLLDFVELCESRWGRYRERMILQFHSPLDEFARLEHARQHIARYRDYAPLLRRAIDRARELGFRVRDVQDPTGVPALCVLGADATYLGFIASQRVRPRLHRWESGWMTHIAACADCDLREHCMGIPRRYLDLHGEEEFQAIHLTPRVTATTPA